jgi:membrane-associated phospholipid phosphatase
MQRVDIEWGVFLMVTNTSSDELRQGEPPAASRVGCSTVAPTGLRGTRLTAVALALHLLVAGVPSAAPQAPDPPSDGDSREEERGPFRRFLAEHGLHLLVAAGADLLTHQYNESVGPSSDPILFSTPGSVDERIREEFRGPSEWGGYLGESGLETLKYGVPVVLIGINLGDGGTMARDLVGFLETFHMKRAITRFTKDLIGRERPALEFAEEDGLGPKEIESLDEKEGNHRSFPSGHSSGAFAFASYLERALARRIGMSGPARVASFTTLYGAAGYIGYSRLRRDKHYLTDVVAGAALGIGVARYYYRLSHPGEYGAGRASGPRRRSRVSLLPPAPIPGGLVLAVDIRLDGRGH